MKILFLHGWQSTPGGVKPTYLKDHGHEVLNPALPDDDFGEALRIAQAEDDQHHPDVVVGSSRGGAVAMNIKVDVPFVLLCPAWKRWGTARTVKPGTVILHSRADETIPFADSQELLRNSGLPESALVVVGFEHRLADPESLAKMLEVVAKAVGRSVTTLLKRRRVEPRPTRVCLNRNSNRKPRSMATISDVARILDVDRDSVKRWASEFAEYMSVTALPRKGQERQFTEADLRVLALIAEHSEMDEEADDIHYALNSGYQHEERFVEFARLHSPLFQEVPEEIDETWQHGVLIGGMACRELPQVARAYKLAVDELVKQALASQEPYELDYPILFLYRHTIELYLKAALTSPPEHHDLGRLIQLLEGECGNKLAGWIRDRLWDFHKIDRMSDMFRYAEPPSLNELWVDLHQVKAVMDRLVEAFESYIASKATAKVRP